MASAAEGTIIYTHNATDALSGSDAQVRQLLDRIRTVNADSIFISEAYRLGASTERIDNAVADLARTHVVAIGPYTEAGRPDQHGFLAAVRKEFLMGRLAVVYFAGRAAVQATMIEKNSGRLFTQVQVHFGDHKLRRQAELDAFFMQYGGHLEARVPLVLAGDLNNAIDNSLFAQAVTAAGRFARSHFADQATMVEQRQGRSVVGRIASLAIRASDQLDGEDICRLMTEGNLTDCNTEHLPTGFVPHLPRLLSLALSMTPGLGAWLLGTPHIEADHIMANTGMLTDFTRYPRLPGDEHLGISAVYRLPPLQTT
jgi:endonuclease/exonuclease/phosphatase family metal-dependent hydrolase